MISYRGANQPNIAVDDPFETYARIFANADLSESELARLIAEQKSVLDFVKDDVARLQNRVNASDRARLEAHLGNLRSIEQRLSNSAVSCTPLEMPEKFDTRAMENFPTVSRLQTDLMLLAHLCGMTNVSTFMRANADSWQYYPFIGVNEEHHELSHAGDDDTAANEKLVKINQWHSEQLAYVLERLEEAKEVDGSSLLDHSVVLWGNELGAGNTHTHMNIPWVLAGRRRRLLQDRSRALVPRPALTTISWSRSATRWASTTSRPSGSPGCAPERCRTSRHSGALQGFPYLVCRGKCAAYLVASSRAQRASRKDRSFRCDAPRAFSAGSSVPYLKWSAFTICERPASKFSL